MKRSRILADKVAIGLSGLCVVHCLWLPITLLMSSTLTLSNEFFHIAMVVLVVPVSLYALTVGLKAHQNRRIFIVGVMGVLLLISALLVESLHLGSYVEKSMTIFATLLLCFAHFNNLRGCDSAACSA